MKDVSRIMLLVRDLYNSGKISWSEGIGIFMAVQCYKPTAQEIEKFGTDSVAALESLKELELEVTNNCKWSDSRTKNCPVGSQAFDK